MSVTWKSFRVDANEGSWEAASYIAPAVLGVVRDSTGGYGAVLCVCMTLQLTGALLISLRTREVA
jgi:hypothetical protein